MGVDAARVIDGRKFMWDGTLYGSQDEAEKARAAYVAEKFEARLVEDQGQFLVYTRRVVTEPVGAHE